MKAYKATYNMNCESLTYEVGKKYDINNFKICSHGFHFCKKMKDTLNYYSYNDEFILLEVEILGATDYSEDKGVTDSMKVLRVVPKEEYTFQIPIIEYDKNGNKTSHTDSDGRKETWTYDKRNNKTSRTYSDGRKETWTYDERNNKTSRTYSNGRKVTWTYDERNNMTSYTNSDGSKATWTYDEKGNKTSCIDSNGHKETWTYDKKGNKTSYTNSNGKSWEITIS